MSHFLETFKSICIVTDEEKNIITKQIDCSTKGYGYLFRCDRREAFVICPCETRTNDQAVSLGTEEKVFVP